MEKKQQRIELRFLDSTSGGFRYPKRQTLARTSQTLCKRHRGDCAIGKDRSVHFFFFLEMILNGIRVGAPLPSPSSFNVSSQNDTALCGPSVNGAYRAYSPISLPRSFAMKRQPMTIALRTSRLYILPSASIESPWILHGFFS